jgi:cyclopropane fatty-acyl-phospholipid synthase-like methyltransferase
LTGLTYDPASHYDRVTQAWQWLLGDDLHYGVFERDDDDDLPAATRRLTDLLYQTARISAGDLVLDVGCGTGAPACWLASLGAQVTGITTSPTGVEAARQRATASGLDRRTEFRLADGMDNGLPDQSFDVVWVLESSHLMRDRAALVAECVRVLRPGGRFVLCDIMLRRTIPLAEVKQLRARFDLLRWSFGDARMESLDTYAERVVAAGLRLSEQRDLTSATRPTFGCWRTNASRYREQVVPLLGEDGLEQFIEASQLLESFWDDRTLGYGLVSAELA